MKSKIKKVSFKGLVSKPKTFSELVETGKAVEISGSALIVFKSSRLAVETRTYARFVEWSNESMRRNGILLDQHSRLNALVKSSSEAARHIDGSCFTCRTTDASADTGLEERHIFRLQNMGTEKSPRWLIDNLIS